MTRRRIVVSVIAAALVSMSALGTVVVDSQASSAWTLRIAQTGASPLASIGSIDPAQGAGFFAQQLLWSTCAFLYDYPDAPAPAGATLRPEAATAFPSVRRSGRNYRYSIHVRSGFRFQDGRSVTAANFVYAIHRDLEKGVATLGPTVLHDLVSATSHGNAITITMDRPAADLPAMLASTLFCAVPVGLPAQPNQMVPMAGPYYIASNTPSEIVLKRNPNYRGNRPHGAAEIDWMFQVPGDAIALQVERGAADYGVVSPAATAPLAAAYGINKSQFFVAPGYQGLCLVLNTSRPLFADNPANSDVPSTSRSTGMLWWRRSAALRAGAPTSSCRTGCRLRGCTRLPHRRA